MTHHDGHMRAIAKQLYDYPAYYDLALSSRDIPHEVDVMEDLMRRFSPVAVSRVLEIACGTCPHMRELVGRGYRFAGVDLNPAMLAYAREQARDLGEQVRLIQADLRNFNLDGPVDFAYVMLGSLYVTTTGELVSHFDAMGRALRPGGLYLLDWVIDFDPHTDLCEAWEEERDGVTAQVTYLTRRVNRVEQTYEEDISVAINDHGETATFHEQCVKRAIYPRSSWHFWMGGRISRSWGGGTTGTSISPSTGSTRRTGPSPWCAGRNVRGAPTRPHPRRRAVLRGSTRGRSCETRWACLRFGGRYNLG